MIKNYRLKEAVNHIKLNFNLLQSDIAIKLSVKNTYLSDMINGRVPLTQNISEKIYELFHIDPNWLLTGEGEMLKSSKPKQFFDEAVIKKPGRKIMAVPLISQYAYAGYLSGYADAEFLEHQPFIIVDEDYTPGHYVAFEVKGDSMTDGPFNSIVEGSIVVCRELYKEHWKSKLRRDETYLIVHHELGICVKEIVDQDLETGRITCHSLNPEYHDFDIFLDDVLQMFYVKEVRSKRGR